MTVNRLPPIVMEIREKLAAGRDKLRRQHLAGSPGIQVCSALTDLFDSVVLELYHETLRAVELDAAEFARGAALMPYGGYGRRDTAPFSDVDVMLLYVPRAEAAAHRFSRRFTQLVVDVGLQLGFSARTAAETCQAATRDATIFTSVAEGRFLIGDEALHARFASQFRKLARRRGRRLIPLIDEARRDERSQFGETNYLLEPNIKRSRGGLRDIQLIRWIGFIRCGEVELENLMRAGVLSREDFQRLHFECLFEREKYPEDLKEKDIELNAAPATRLHMKDFLAAVKTRGKPVADIEDGHISTASCILANLSMHLGRPLTYDPKQRIVTGDAEATRLLRRTYRGPWQHPNPEAFI